MRGGGEGVVPYISHIGVSLPKGRVLGPFCLKTGIHFAHFGLESGTVFQETTGAYKCIYRFNSK